MSIGREFEQIVVTSSLRLDPALAIAASRAGELGVLNLEFVDDVDSASKALLFLSDHIESDCGVRIAGRNHVLLEQ
jgi:hypothetical protein